MSHHEPIPENELEEAAQGQDLFRAPGADLQIEQARDQATASGWLPPDVVFHWPSTDSHRQIINRRQDLYDAMRRLETSVARASGQEDWNEVVREALTNLDSALLRHVNEIEASDGLFSEVVETAPQLSSHVERLRQEHDDLIAACRTALDMASRGVSAEEIRRKVLVVLGRLTIHRQRGAELLFDAYDVDLAAAN